MAELDEKKNIKLELSSGIDKLLENQDKVSDSDKYRLYVKSQYVDDEIKKEEADKYLKEIQDNKFSGVDDANAWVSSTIAGNENLYKSEKTQDKVDKLESQATRDNELISQNIDTKKMAKKLGIDENTIIDDLNMSELDKQKNVYLKTDLSDNATITKIENRRLDEVLDKETREFCDGVTITGDKDKISVKSDYLGDFTYDPKQFALGYKEITEKNGTKSKLPVLEYIAGDEGEAGFDFGGAFHGTMRTGFSSIHIPNGLKNMDYMFANQKQLRYMPELPDSITSAHCAFANCSEMLVPQNASTERGEGWNVAGALVHAHYRVKFPEGLEDMSGMFKNNTKLKANFEKLPVNLKNGTDAFKGCEELGGREEILGGLIGQDLKAPQFGTDITPYLTSQYAKDITGDISNEKVKQYGDNVDFYINKDGTVNNKYKDKIDVGLNDKSIDKTAFDNSKSQTALEHSEDIIKGTTLTEAEIASNGMRSQNKVYNADTKSFEYDETGEIGSDNKPKQSLWQRIVIDGAVGLGGYAITKSMTGSRAAGLLVGIGGTALLDYTNVLPETLSPVFKGVANMMPDGPFKDKLNGLADKFNTGGEHTVNDQKKYFTKDRVSEAHAEDRLMDSVKAMSGAGYMSEDATKESMQNGGKAAATSGALWAAAREGEDGKIIESVKNRVNDFTNQAYNTTLVNLDPKTRNADAKEYYSNLFKGLKEYNAGAVAGINAYSNDTTKKDLASEGLNMTNRAYAASVMDSISKYEESYKTKLFDDKELSALSNNISGIGDLKDYKTNKFEAQKDDTSAKRSSLIELDKADYELDNYDEPEHAYKSRADKRKEMQSELNISENRKSDTYVSEKKSDGNSIKQDIKPNNTKSDYAKRAEDKFGDILKADNSGLDYQV